MNIKNIHSELCEEIIVQSLRSSTYWRKAKAMFEPLKEAVFWHVEAF